TVPVCVVAGRTITIEAGTIVRATTMLPLVLIADITLEVRGEIDASSQPLSAGAGGANAAACPAGTDPTLRGGGQGGSCGAVGGAGGDGVTGGMGGTAGAAIVPTALRAGCRGASTAALTGGGGEGGGAVYLIAGDSITISGKVNASGSGGAGGDPSV